MKNEVYSPGFQIPLVLKLEILLREMWLRSFFCFFFKTHSDASQTYTQYPCYWFAATSFLVLFCCFYNFLFVFSYIYRWLLEVLKFWLSFPTKVDRLRDSGPMAGCARPVRSPDSPFFGRTDSVLMGVAYHSGLVSVACTECPAANVTGLPRFHFKACYYRDKACLLGKPNKEVEPR